MPSLTVKKESNVPPLEMTITDATGKAIDLTAAVKVTIKYRSKTGKKDTERTMTVKNAAKGEVSDKWPQAAEPLNTVDEYEIELKIEWSATEFEYVPNEGPLPTINVIAQLP